MNAMKILSGILLAALVLGCGGCAGAPEEPVSTLLFALGDGGSKYYRIPALVTADDGSLVAVADRRLESMGDLPNKSTLWRGAAPTGVAPGPPSSRLPNTAATAATAMRRW